MRIRQEVKETEKGVVEGLEHLPHGLVGQSHDEICVVQVDLVTAAAQLIDCSGGEERGAEKIAAGRMDLCLGIPGHDSEKEETKYLSQNYPQIDSGQY